MVKIGEVFWVASVKGADTATEQADEIEDSMGSVASSATEAANAQNRYGEATSEAGERTGRLSFLTGGLNVAQSLLGSTLFFTAQSFGVAGTAATAYAGAMTVAAAASTGLTAAAAKLSGVVAAISGALAVASGKASGLIAWFMAGSAGALALAAGIGVAVGLMGVFALEITGVMDRVRNFGRTLGTELPGWARDGIINLISLFAGGLAIIGGFISGFVRGFISDFQRARENGVGIVGSLWAGITGGFRQGVNDALGVFNIFVGAWERQLARLKSASDAGWNRLQQGWTDLKDWIFGIVDGIVGKIMEIPDAAKEAASSIPGADLAGGAVGATGGVVGGATDVGGDLISGGRDLLGIQSGGVIQESGVAEVHRGEAVIPRRLVEAAERPAASGGDGSGDTTVEQTYDIDLGDQSLDLSTLDRSTLRVLARMIGEEMGTATGNVAGGK